MGKHSYAESFGLGREQARQEMEEYDREIVKADGRAGELIAEGDSWFDYLYWNIGYNVVKALRQKHGFKVHSLARSMDSVETMAYGERQLDPFLDKIRELAGRGVTPKAILLSAGGNDIAAPQFRQLGFPMLLNHAASPLGSLNAKIVDGTIDRIFDAYARILGKVTETCEAILGKRVRIICHGYAYAVPDGRGITPVKGIGFGPWLAPAFDWKGYTRDLKDRTKVVGDLIDVFNTRLAEMVKAPVIGQHVRYIDVRKLLPTYPARYRGWWSNELHPSKKGWNRVADAFAAEINKS